MWFCMSLLTLGSTAMGVIIIRNMILNVILPTEISSAGIFFVRTFYPWHMVDKVQATRLSFDKHYAIHVTARSHKTQLPGLLILNSEKRLLRSDVQSILREVKAYVSERWPEVKIVAEPAPKTGFEVVPIPPAK